MSSRLRRSIILEFFPLAGSLWGELRFDELLLGFSRHRDRARDTWRARARAGRETAAHNRAACEACRAATLKVCEGDCTSPGGGNGHQERGT